MKVIFIMPDKNIKLYYDFDMDITENGFINFDFKTEYQITKIETNIGYDLKVVFLSETKNKPYKPTNEQRDYLEI